MENSNTIYISSTIDLWCWELFHIWIKGWVYLMFMMMLGGKFLSEHIFSQFITLSIIAEGSEIEISIDKLYIIFSSMNKFLAGIGLG